MSKETINYIEKREKQRIATIKAIAIIAEVSFEKAEKALDRILERYNEQLRIRIEYDEKIKEKAEKM